MAKVAVDRDMQNEGSVRSVAENRFPGRNSAISVDPAVASNIHG
jgi:hypothetical protein